LTISETRNLVLSLDTVLAKQAERHTDLSGQPLRYAKGYEPRAIIPTSKTEAFV
jgi:hypothetical protein